MCLFFLFFFFFKQKTAYEMRISDWSSDVCSSDLQAFGGMLAPAFAGRVPDITEENLQSRVRGVTLMALSNKFGHMVLTTGNKSEMSVDRKSTRLNSSH